MSITHLVIGTSISPDSHPCCSRYPDSACSAPEDALPSLFPPCPASRLEGGGWQQHNVGRLQQGCPPLCLHLCDQKQLSKQILPYLEDSVLCSPWLPQTVCKLFQ